VKAANFKILMQSVYPAMLRQAAAIVRDRSAAQDVVQDVACHLWQKPEGLEKADSPQAYILSAVRNTAISAVRNKHMFEPIDEARSVAVPPASDEETPFINTLLLRLQPMQRRAFSLRQFAEMEYDEIAGELGTSPANVRQLVSRARKTLKELYKRYEQDI
jgi:RNA polymerase sigma-70 factor (ECF subfamily)